MGPPHWVPRSPSGDDDVNTTGLRTHPTLGQVGSCHSLTALWSQPRNSNHRSAPSNVSEPCPALAKNSWSVLRTDCWRLDERRLMFRVGSTNVKRSRCFN